MNNLKTTELIPWYRGTPEFSGYYLLKYMFDGITFVSQYYWNNDSKSWANNVGQLPEGTKVLYFAPVPKGP